MEFLSIFYKVVCVFSQDNLYTYILSWRVKQKIFTPKVTKNVDYVVLGNYLKQKFSRVDILKTRFPEFN